MFFALQLDRGNLAAFDAAKLHAMVARDARQIRSMVRLVDDMLDVSRLRSGQLSIREKNTELSALLERIVSDLSHQATAAGTTITLHHEGEPATGFWDEFRIEQVVVNLLTNALRYGGGKPIKVRVRTDADSAVIEVTDQGIGISEQGMQRIFEPFESAVDSGKPAGLGLGLYIARQLVEAHGGSIGVQSTPGAGSVFHVSLPLQTPPAAPMS